MEAYKTAFEGLADIIRKGDDMRLVRSVNKIEQTLNEFVETKEADTKATPTKEEFEAMTYSERNALHTEHPDVYKQAVSGIFKGVE